MCFSSNQRMGKRSQSECSFKGDTGSWTVVVTDTQGRSCLVVNGESWTQVPLLVGDPS